MRIASVKPFAFAAHLSDCGNGAINRDANRMGTIHDPPSMRLDIQRGLIRRQQFEYVGEAARTAHGSIDHNRHCGGRPI
jgi:hypothetical protein